jgi:FMN hydrolase / 5-amino-6-(5-phospho-D-ribitylamino)uracil phosphatase
VIEVITFDLDDTLWDARPAFERAEQAHLDWLALHAPAVAEAHPLEEMRRLRLELAARRHDIAHDFTRLREEALKELLLSHDYDPALARFGIEHFVRVRSEVTLYPDTVRALADLKRDYTLVALTNGNADLRVAGVAEYFSDCISPAQSGVQKPDPRMFKVALERAGAVPERAVHVGDHPLYDIEGARRASVRGIWVNRIDTVWPDQYARAAAEISSLSALRAAIEDLGRAI